MYGFSGARGCGIVYKHWHAERRWHPARWTCGTDIFKMTISSFFLTPAEWYRVGRNMWHFLRWQTEWQAYVNFRISTEIVKDTGINFGIFCLTRNDGPTSYFFFNFSRAFSVEGDSGRLRGVGTETRVLHRNGHSIVVDVY